jgi:ADP-ribose pyrophosphatase
MIRLGTFYPTPGYCDEQMVFFKVSSLETPTAAAAQDEDEDIEVKTFTLGEVRDMIRRGEISDLKTIVGLRLI